MFTKPLSNSTPTRLQGKLGAGLAVLAGSVTLALGTAESAQALVLSFVSNPSSNRADWTADVTSRGYAINSNVNFETHPVGTLQSDFYTSSDGVTLTPSGDVNEVRFGAGPGQSNTNGSVPGEGTNSASNYLFDGPTSSTLTISFSSPVAGVGFDTIDYFGAGALTIEAFTGANGTGTSLGSFNSVTQNFQINNLYFMGLVSTDGNIGSLVFRNPATFSDSIGIDNIVFANNTTAVPFEFSPTLGLLLIGAGVGAERWWRSRRRQQISLEENA